LVIEGVINMRNSSIRNWFTFFLLCILLLGCQRHSESSSTANGPGRSGSMLVLVAASTQDAVQENAAKFSQETGIEVKINADDSSKLTMQIAHDVPADIFLSANEEWAAVVKDKGFAQEWVPLLGNSLVIVVPKGNPANVTKAEDLIGAAVKHVAIAGPTVP